MAKRQRHLSNSDRISTLPDHLLHRILRRTPTRQVAQMAILSRRWRYIWLTIPSLDLDQNTSLPLSEYLHAEPNDPRYISNLNFINFVNTTLELRRQTHTLPIATFSLHFTHNYSKFDASPWITYAFDHAVRSLSFWGSYCKQLYLPSFTFASLKNLSLVNLSRDVQLAWPNSLLMPSLIRLFLASVSTKGSIDGDVITVSCPRLEFLTLSDCREVAKLDIVRCFYLEKLKLCRVTKLEVLTVNAMKLKSFTFTGELWLVAKVFELNAPRLHEFSWDSNEPHHCIIHTCNPQNVVFKNYRVTGTPGLFLRLLDAKIIHIEIVSLLTLCSLLQNGIINYEQAITCGNISHMKVDLSFSRNLHLWALSYLTNCSPNLRTLTLSSKIRWGGEDEGFVHNIVLSLDTLIELEIKDLRATEEELYLVKLLISSAHVIQKVEVHFIKSIELNKRKEYSDKIKDLALTSSQPLFCFH